MSDLDARLIETREAVAAIGPPADLWARVVDRANDGCDVPVHDLRVELPRRRRSPRLVAVAVAVVVALGAALLQLDDEQPVDTVPAGASTTTTTKTSVAPDWSGPVRKPSDVVHRMAVDEERAVSVDDEVVFGLKWEDPVDAPEGWSDVVRVAYQAAGQPNWSIGLAATPPRAVDVEPGLVIAYGLVLDTTGDGVADHLIGIDNDAPVRGDFHVWVTDLATGETDEQVGPPYGFPIEFLHPDEAQPGDPPRPPTIMFTFLPGSGPEGLNPETVRFYAWTSATRDGEVVAHDYAPDTGWITSDAP